MSPRYAIVTGGAAGIGRVFCRTLGERGWHVAIADVDLQAAREAARDIPSAHAYRLDVADYENWKQLRRHLAAEWPRLDLLVNCAGVLLAGDLGSCSSEAIAATIQTNLMGTIWGARVMVPWISRTADNQSNAEIDAESSNPPRGVINIASIFGVVSPPQFSVYAASKGGVLAFSEALRGELRPRGLNVTVAVPGVTRTGLFERGSYTSPEVRAQTLLQAESATVSPEGVVQVTLEAASRRRLYAVAGLRANWYWHLKHLLPQSVIDSVGRRVNKAFPDDYDSDDPLED